MSEARKHVFGFLDETGLLHSPSSDQFFGLGLLIAQHPSEIHRHIIAYRNKMNYGGEFKFSDVRQENLRLYTGLVDLFFLCRDLRFYCSFYDKRKLDVPGQFKKGYDSAYNTFAARLVASAVSNSEYIALLADDVSTKKDNNFERQIREKVKQKARRNALFGICRLESHAVAEIQLVDVLVGSVAYAFKIKHRQLHASHKSAKLQLVKHLQKKLAIETIAEKLNRKMLHGLRFSVEEY